jgi:hypothetical protein
MDNEKAIWRRHYGLYMTIEFPDGREIFAQEEDMDRILEDLGVSEAEPGDWDYIENDWPYYGDYYGIAQFPEDK